MNYLMSPPNDYVNEISNSIVSSISKQKDNIIFEVLAENDIDIFNLTELAKKGRFLKYRDENYTIFNYDGKDLLIIYEPDITFTNDKVNCEVKFKKLYNGKIQKQNMPR
jgi:hypothetical protein